MIQYKKLLIPAYKKGTYSLMKKKISKKKQAERRRLLKLARNQRIILALSAVPPFAFTVTTIIIYAIKKQAFSWLLAVSSITWILLGALFIYADKKKWGCVSQVGVKTDDNTTVVTLYNIILIFALALLFAILFIRQLFA